MSQLNQVILSIYYTVEEFLDMEESEINDHIKAYIDEIEYISANPDASRDMGVEEYEDMIDSAKEALERLQSDEFVDSYLYAIDDDGNVEANPFRRVRTRLTDTIMNQLNFQSETMFNKSLQNMFKSLTFGELLELFGTHANCYFDLLNYTVEKLCEKLSPSEIQEYVDCIESDIDEIRRLIPEDMEFCPNFEGVYETVRGLYECGEFTADFIQRSSFVIFALVQIWRVQELLEDSNEESDEESDEESNEESNEESEEESDEENKQTHIIRNYRSSFENMAAPAA